MEWIAGFVIAATMGLTGIGGGSLTVTVLALAGLPIAESVGTAMIFSAVLRLVIAPVYMVRKHVHAGYLGRLLIGAAPGLLIGAWALRLMDNTSRRASVLLVVGIMFFISSVVAVARRLHRPEFAGRNGGWLVLLALIIGMATGFSAAGAGALVTVLLLNFSEMPVEQVIGTNIVFGIVLALMGSAFYLEWGPVETGTLLRLVAGGIPGAFAGCALAKRISSSKLRTAVALIAIALGLQLVSAAVRDLLKNHAAAAPSAPASALTR